MLLLADGCWQLCRWQPRWHSRLSTLLHPDMGNPDVITMDLLPPIENGNGVYDGERVKMTASADCADVLVRDFNGDAT